MTSSVAGQLAEWGASVKWRDLSEEVKHKTRLMWLDTVGCLYLGYDHPEVKTVAEALFDRNGSGEVSTVVGVPLSGYDASLVNGLATGVDLFDGGNVASGGHVAGYVLPAVLTESQRLKATFEKALEAFLVGYEIACRIGSSQRLRPELHPSATWNVIGAAAAAAKLSGESAAGLARVIELAANLTLTTSWDATVHGATVRDVYHGMPSYLGLLAADLARVGFTGGPSSVEVTFGQLSSIAPFDTGHAVGGFGERWLLDETYTKIYPTCRSFHAALDAAVRAAELLPEDVDFAQLDVTVGTEPFAFQQNAAVHYGSSLAARESLPVSAALALVARTLTPGQFRNSAYSAEPVISLAQRMRIVSEERRSPRSRPGWVHLVGPNVNVRESVDIPAGNPGNLLAESVVRSKFIDNATAFLGSASVEAAEEMISGSTERPCFDVVQGPHWK